MSKVFWSSRFLTLVAVGLALFGILELARGFSALFAPVSTDFSEMMVAGMAQQLLNTGRLDVIYSPPLAPYSMPGIQYPPLFTAVTALFIWLGGVGPVLTARLLAWAGYFLAGVMVGLIVRHETGNSRIALLAAFFPFNFWSVLIFINGARPDPLALLLSLLGAYLYRKGQTPLFSSVPLDLPPNKFFLFIRLTGVAFVFMLAFYTKQTYLAAASAVFVDLLIKKGRRFYALAFGSFFAGFCAAGWLTCQFFSRGTFGGIFEPQRAGRFIFDLAPAMAGFFLLDHFPLILIALFGLAYLWQEGHRFWALYLLLASLACISIIKDGAVDYYFNEVAYLLSIAVGFALALVFKTGVSFRFSRFIPALAAVQLTIAAGMFLVWNQWRDNDNFLGVYREARAIVQQYHQNGKPALIFQNNFLIETNQFDLIGDYFIYWILIGNGRRDIRTLQTDLEMHKYELIMVGSPQFRRWPPALEQPLEAGYRLKLLSGLDGRPLYWLYTRRET